MNKAIIMRINSEGAVDILNGDKTIEVRINIPACKLPIDVYLYCSKAKPYLKRCECGAWQLWNTKEEIDKCCDYFNGLVVAKFTLNSLEDSRNIDIFNKPKEIGKFYAHNDIKKEWKDYWESYEGFTPLSKEQYINIIKLGKAPMNQYHPLTKAPLSWQYCYVKGE